MPIPRCVATWNDLLSDWRRMGILLFRHDAEGPDDMPAHVRSLIFGHELTVPIRAGALGLGTWQGIYLWEHRTPPCGARSS